MTNIRHQDFTLDENHAIHARVYADIAARDADTAFNTNAAQLGKAVLVNSPASIYTLLTTAPLFLELSNVTAGNVTTSDALLAGQLLLGNGASDIVTEPDLTFAAGVFTIGGSQTLINAPDVRIRDNNIILGNVVTPTDITADGGGITLLGDTDKTILWSDSSNVWEFSNSIRVPSLSVNNQFIHMISGATWDINGIQLSANNALSFDGDAVLSDAGGIVTLGHINQLDSTTQLNIENAMTGLANLISIQSLAIALADAGQDAFWGWVDGESTYRNLTPAEASAIIGAGDVTTSDTLIAGQLLLGNGGKDIVTEPDLVWDGAMFGIGIADPISPLHVYENTGAIDATAGLTIEQDGSGDAMMHFILTGDESWTAGIDNSDNNNFKISNDSVFFGNSAFTISMSLENVGIGQGNPTTRLSILSNLGDTGAIVTTANSGANGASTRDFVGTRDPEGNVTGNPGDRYHRVNGVNSGLFIFKAASAGMAGWVEAVTGSGFGNVTTSDTLSATQLLLGNGGADIVTEPDLVWDGANFGIHQTSPESPLHVLTPGADTQVVLTLESTTNPGKIGFRTGDRTPEGNVNGVGGDVYYADRGLLSGTYESREVSASTNWLKRSVNPVDVIEILNSAEFDDLASGGIITLTSDTTFHIKGQIVTSTRIVAPAGVRLTLTGDYGANPQLIYTGSDTFITSSGFVGIFATLQLISASTGTCFSLTGPAALLILRGLFLIDWVDMGSLNGAGGFFASDVTHVNMGAGYDITDCPVVSIKDFLQAGTPFSGSFFIINSRIPNTTMSFSEVLGQNLDSSGSVFDINTRLDNNSVINIRNSAAVGGDLFNPSTLTNATLNSVADGSIATGTITAMADNGSGGTTISAATTYFEDEEVTITGTTSYNGTFQIFNVVPGVSFDTITPFVADDAAGSLDTDRLTLSVAGGHGIVTGDSVKIIDTNFYNGFQTVLDQSVNDLTVNGTFVATDTGSIERDLSLDESDPRIDAKDNFGISDSAMIACAHVNDNSTVNGSITNNVFTDMVFGTAGDALQSSTSMERWRLIDEINGTFEYFGLEPFDGKISFDFTVISTGGTVDFRFKWMIDTGSGFVDLPDDVESLVAVGSDAQSITKTYPLKALKGDKIKPQITRNSGSSGITSTFVTIYVGM